jgi:hypothetical protein
MKLFAAVAIAVAALAAPATAATPTLTIAASTPSVTYGKTVTLTGALSTLKANQNITVLGTECGSTKAGNAAKVKTTANGAYTATVTPTVMTVYQATQGRNVKSPTVTITVKPLVQIKRVKRGSFTATVTAGIDLKGKTLLFQRYATAKKRWRQVKKVTLTTSAPGTPKPTIVSSAAFTAKVAKRARVRVALTKAQAGACYLPANSNVVRN